MGSCKEVMVSWVNSAHGSGDKSAPPAGIVAYADLLEESWGWDRLVPYDSVVDLHVYVNYLEQYYKHNSLDYLAAEQKTMRWPLRCATRLKQISSHGVGNGNGLTAAAKFCLVREERLMSLWKSLPECEIMTLPSVILLSGMIQDCARHVAKTGGDFSDMTAAAFVCIGKEADLMSEMIRLKANPIYDGFEQINAVRMCAFHLASHSASNYTIVAATMVGMAKEAKLMCDWMSKRNQLISYDNPHVPSNIFECNTIRESTFGLMASLVDDYFSSDFASIAVSKPALEAIRNDTAAAEAAKPPLETTSRNQFRMEQVRKRKSKEKGKKTREPKIEDLIMNQDGNKRVK